MSTFSFSSKAGNPGMGSTPAFGATTSLGGFGSSTFGSSSPFGKNTTSTFTTAPNSAPVFGSTGPTNATGFGASTTFGTTSNSMFGSTAPSTSSFGTTPSTPGFGSNSLSTNAATNSLASFTNPTTASTFGFGSSFGNNSMKPTGNSFTPSAITLGVVPQKIDEIQKDTKYQDLPVAYKVEVDTIYKDFKSPLRTQLEKMKRHKGSMILEWRDKLENLRLLVSNIEVAQQQMHGKIISLLDEIRPLYREFKTSSTTGISQIKSRGGGIAGGRIILLDEQLPDPLYLTVAESLERRLIQCVSTIKYFEKQLVARSKALNSFYGGDLGSNEHSLKGSYGQILKVGPSQLLNLMKQQAEAFAIISKEVYDVHHNTNILKQHFLKYFNKANCNPFERADKSEIKKKADVEEKLKLETIKLTKTTVVPQVPTNQSSISSPFVGNSSIGPSNGAFPAPAMSGGFNLPQNPSPATSAPPVFGNGGSFNPTPSTSVAALDLATTGSAQTQPVGFGFPLAGSSLTSSSLGKSSSTSGDSGSRKGRKKTETGNPAMVEKDNLMKNIITTKNDQSVIVYNRRDATLKSIGSYKVEHNDDLSFDIICKVLRKYTSENVEISCLMEVFINNILKSHLSAMIPSLTRKKLALLHCIELVMEVFNSNWPLLIDQFTSDKVWENSDDLATSMHEILSDLLSIKNVESADRAILISLLDFWILQEVDTSNENYVIAMKSRLQFLLKHMNQLIICLPSQDGNEVVSRFLESDAIFLEGTCSDFHGLCNDSKERPLRFICVMDIMESSEYHGAFSSVEQIDTFGDCFQRVITALQVNGINVILLGCVANSKFISFCSLRNIFVIHGIKTEYFSIIASQLKYLKVYQYINDVTDSINYEDVISGFSSIQRVVSGGQHAGFLLRGLYVNDNNNGEITSLQILSSTFCGLRCTGQLLLDSRCAIESKKNFMVIFEEFVRTILHSITPTGKIIRIIDERAFDVLSTKQTNGSSHILTAALTNSIENSSLKSIDSVSEVFETLYHCFEWFASHSFQMYTESVLKTGLRRTLIFHH